MANINMALFICLLILGIIVICKSLPTDRTETENVRKMISFKEFVSETGHNIVKRSKRSGIISGHLCPTGTGKLYGTGDCIPCDGQPLQGCPEVPDDPEYNDD